MTTIGPKFSLNAGMPSAPIKRPDKDLPAPLPTAEKPKPNPTPRPDGGGSIFNA